VFNSKNKKRYYCIDCKKEIDHYKSTRCFDCYVKARVPWNKGKKGSQVAWNKGKKCPQYQKEKHYNWKGGKTIQNGYIYVLAPGHPKAKTSHKNKRGYVAEHVLVMEKKLGRYLQGDECVHHIDNNPHNNKISNLLLFHNMREHMIACHPKEHIKYGRKKGQFKRSY